MTDDLELYKRYRPTKFKEMRGQDAAVAQLEDMVKKGKVPHSILMSGPSGCGKTTAARILASKLNCEATDLKEVNSADFRGIDTIRDIRRVMTSRGLGGGSRVWIIDEFHMASKDAMAAFLKYLEDTPSHVYFMLCTTHPDKLLPAIHTRCTEIRFKSVCDADLIDLLVCTLNKEDAKVAEDVVEKIAEVCEGSPRKALVLLQQVMGLPPEDQLDAVQKSEVQQEGIQIARALLDNRTTWAQMAKILRECKEEPESLRHLVLSYANKVLLGGKNAGRAFLMIQAFRDHWYDCKEAGLTSACYEVISSK